MNFWKYSKLLLTIPYYTQIKHKFCFSETLIFLFILFVLVLCPGVTNVDVDVAKLCLGLDVFPNNIAVID